ncbi:hypothetical protein EG329_013589 [Mollisiaceae sp. DMI_Dod_QoI]|nr:hypothetical protein EG329_013589 [Helotiales sp. DMI_Dod_QoI]
MEAHAVPDGQTAAGFGFLMGVSGGSLDFHSNINVGIDSILDTAGIGGTRQQDLVHSIFNPYDFGRTTYPSPLSWGQSFPNDVPEANHMLLGEDFGYRNISQAIQTSSEALANDWVKIGPMFKFVYETNGCTLEQTASFLEIVFGFRATLDKYRYRLKLGWPNDGARPCENGRRPRERLRKNKSISVKSTMIKAMKGGKDPHRNRSYKRSGNYNPCPQFLAMRPRVCIPQPLEPEIYKSYILLLRYIDKYVTGFFDSLSSIEGRAASEENFGNHLVLVESNWQRLLNCCQGMLALLRKGKHLVLPNSSKERPLSKGETTLYIRKTIERTLEYRVFSRVGEMNKDCSPFVLNHFWNICNILLDLSRQLGYSRGAYVARLLRSLRLSLDHDSQSMNIGFYDIVKHLEPYFVDHIRDDDDDDDDKKQKQNGESDRPEVNGHQGGRKENVGQQENQQDDNQTGNEDEEIQRQKKQEYIERQKYSRKIRKEMRQQVVKESQMCNSETKNIIRTSYQCATRAFSTRRNPTDPSVLKIWANYCRQWDNSAIDTEKFLESYQEAFRKTEQVYGPHHDHTIDVLCNYTVTAYYTCHAKDLAGTLATDLWNRTQDVCYSQQPTWGAKTRGMVEAATILGLSVCIYHENMHKDSKTRQKIRQKLGLRRKKYRQIWRKTLGPPPPPAQANNTLTYLNQAVQSLTAGDWDCQILAQDMAYTLAGLLLSFSGPEVQYKQAASDHLKRGNQCLSRIFSEADPFPGINMTRVIEDTIHPAQLHSQSWTHCVDGDYDCHGT